MIDWDGVFVVLLGTSLLATVITLVVMLAWSYGESRNEAPPDPEPRPCRSNLLGGYKCIHQENHECNHEDARGRQWI